MINLRSINPHGVNDAGTDGDRERLMTKETVNGKETLVDTIHEKIKRDIIAHELLPGERLRTKELAERYGVSETPVKLALNRLCTEHVIDNYPRQGMRVHEFTAEEAEEIFDIRLMIDLYYAREVIDTVACHSVFQTAFKKNVEGHLAVTKGIGETASLEEYFSNYDYDCAFHELYLKCTGNRKILDVYHSIDPFGFFTYVFHRQSPKRDLAGAKEHLKIYEAIMDRDEERLKACLRERYENSEKAVTRLLRVEKML